MLGQAGHKCTIYAAPGGGPFRPPFVNPDELSLAPLPLVAAVLAHHAPTLCDLRTLTLDHFVQQTAYKTAH